MDRTALNAPPHIVKWLSAVSPAHPDTTTAANHYLFHGQAAAHAGPPSDGSEAERIEWIPLAGIGGLVASGEIVSGPTLIGLLLAGA